MLHEYIIMYYPTIINIESRNASVFVACEIFFPPLLPQEALLRKTTVVRYLHQLSFPIIKIVV